ncbi:aldehyde dehydrogenase [Paracoccus versutus]|uniref:Aldehyde dehydrogenase (NAD+) n=1 Tax=Paracoccus versutus TaxID=34007 RepID=A0A3D9XSB9_PARVE|nr:aldehyde dehydrogenase [Paracoccus versutus]REF73295.1 aldehyde dehydrogenase (NAD+) [Paracoccus versutus]WGR54680.1 aldehyde dehydrogenase [Paracoccus versutus]
MHDHPMFIDGSHQPAAGGAWLESTDPYKGEVWARIPRGGAEDADRAVKAARRALKSGPWSTMSATKRGHLLRAIGDGIARNADRLAEIETRDNGKILAEMKGQMNALPEFWYYYAGLADKIEGSVPQVDKPDTLAMTVREPVGVVAALTSWNSPLTFVAMKCAPALAAGCTVVLKPSEFASVSTLAFAQIAKEAGLPDGVINIVTGLGSEIGGPLVQHPLVDKVTFTGSDSTGRMIYQLAAASMKRVTMELGGKSPNIVFEDADLDAAAVGAVAGIFGAAGQMCTAGSRLLVQNSIKEAFTERLVSLTRTIRMGDPNSSETNIGPIATPPQFQKVLSYIEAANADGARCVIGGKVATVDGSSDGQFIEPTIFTDVTNNMKVAQEEIFGPVLSIIGFEDEAEAVEIANDVIFGLAAGVWTADFGRQYRMARALEAGTVWVNTYRAYSPILPIGGMKQSGLGREGGLVGIDDYLETKSILFSTGKGQTANPFLQR